MYAIYQRLGTLVIARFMSLSDVAVYTLAVNIVTLLWTIASTTESLVLHAMARARDLGDAAIAKAMDSGWRAMMTYAALISAFLITFAHEVVLLAGGVEFAAAAAVLPVLALVPLVNAPDTIRYVFYVKHKPHIAVLLFAVLVIVEALSYPLALEMAGLTGVAASRVVARALFLAAIAVGALRMVHGAAWRRPFAGVLGCAMLALAGGVAAIAATQFVNAMDAPVIVQLAIKALIAAALVVYVAYVTGSRHMVLQVLRGRRSLGTAQ
jgi:O-antigen/teichoic acid export membrane protein